MGPESLLPVPPWYVNGRFRLRLLTALAHRSARDRQEPRCARTMHEIAAPRA